MELNEEKKQKSVWSRKKYILFSVICILCVFLLTSFLLINMTLRHYVQADTIPQTMETVALEKIKVRQSGKGRIALAQYIYDQYIQDERIDVEKVEEILHDGTFTKFAADLTEQYNQYLIGEGEFPEIKAEDFIRLLEENGELIYKKIGLRFLEPDKQKLEQNLEQPLKKLNRRLHINGFFLRIGISGWMQPIQIILMIGGLVWMIIIQIKGNQKIGAVFRRYSITAGIPGIGIFLFGLLMPVLLPLISLPAELGTALRWKTVFFSGIGILICIVLFGIGILWNKIAMRKQTEPVAEVPRNPSTVHPVPIEPEKPVEPKRRYCRYCGRMLVSLDAQFCYHCGKKQKQEKKQSV